MPPDTVFSVTPNTAKTQFQSEISALANGGFAVVWSSDEGPAGASPVNIFLQRYDYLGVAAGQTVQVNTTVGNMHSDAAVTGLRGGGFVVAWTASDQDAEERGTYGRVYDALGQPLGGEIQLHTRENSFQAGPRIAALASGGFVATWTSDGIDGDAGGIAAQRFSASGARLGPEFVVNSTVAQPQAFPDVAALENGGFVVAWHGRAPGTTTLLEIDVQRFAEDGTPLGPELRIGTDPTRYTGFPSISGLENGGFVVTWRERDLATGDDRIMAQDFGPGGGAQRPAFQVNAHVDGGQFNPRVTGLEDGGFLITWDGFGATGPSADAESGIWAQRYAVGAVPVGGQFALDQYDGPLAGESYRDASVSSLSDGGYAVTFTQQIAGFTAGFDIAARFSQGTRAVAESGGAGNDLLTGGRFGDTLSGAGGNDRLIGREGADRLSGGDGSDTLDGGVGDDFLLGGASTADLRDVVYGGDGQDSIDGGWGNDDLNGGNGNDTVLGGFGSDTLVGNDGNDVIGGGAGSDLMFGNAGNDTLNGGFGYDRMNGGAGADSFYHLGVADHASDWIQDYNAADGDVLTVGIAGATRAQFQVNRTFTPNAGDAGVQEAFVIYRPSGQILWALVDGGDDAVINIAIGGQVFDLLA